MMPVKTWQVLVLVGCLLAPAAASAGNGGFDLSWVEFTATSEERDSERRFSGTSGRLNLGLDDRHWLLVERDMMSRDLDGNGLSETRRFGRVAFGAAHHATDEGLWFLELGLAHARDELRGSSVGPTVALGIRTRISPRFELGGGPHWSEVSRTDPDREEWFFRIQGVFDLSDRVALSGMYDHHDDGFRWRAGVRLAF